MIQNFYSFFSVKSIILADGHESSQGLMTVITRKGVISFLEETIRRVEDAKKQQQNVNQTLVIDPVTKWTALHLASESDDHYGFAARMIQELGVDPNLRNKQHVTPLHIAAFNNASKIARLLIENEAIVDILDRQLLTPLYLAVVGNSFMIVKLMLDALKGKSNRNVNAEDSTGQTALHKAVQKGSFEIVELLLTDQKVRIDVQDRKGFTPLHFAAARNDVRIAELLLRKGNIRKIDLNAIKDNEGNSVLHIAAAWKADEVVFKLIGTNVDINERNNFGCTPLLLAVSNQSSNTAEFLLQNKARWSIPAYNGDTVLHVSVHHGLSKIVRWLLEEGCDPNTKNNDGVMPMQMASLNSSDIIVDLLKHGAKSDVYDKAGWTIWHEATACKSERIIDALLENCKEFVNIKNKGGATPLHFAAYLNAEEIATKLIEKGAEVDSLDANRETPLFYAAAGNSWTVAMLLLDSEDTKSRPRSKKRVQSNNSSKRTIVFGAVFAYVISVFVNHASSVCSMFPPSLFGPVSFLFLFARRWCLTLEVEHRKLLSI